MVLKSKLMVLGTGGTIAGLASHGRDAQYHAGQVQIDDLWQNVLDCQRSSSAQAPISVQLEQVCQLDSKDMDFPWVQKLVARCAVHMADPSVTAVVITHGTDTLEETAWLLQALLPSHKPVVITGAMRPSNVLGADGPSNLSDAVLLASQPDALGFWVVMAGSIHRADAVRKVHPYQLNAFSSGEQTPAGWIESGRVRWSSAAMVASERFSSSVMQAGKRQQVLEAFLSYGPRDWPWIEVLSSGLGVSAAGVDALVRAGVEGLVIVGTGNATLQASMEAALVMAQAQGVLVVVVTRCTQGRIVAVADAPILPVAYEKTAAQARMAMVLDWIADRRTPTPTPLVC